ncbi:MAG: ABC transporter permease [Rhodospirillales bacterium]|nr:ABC transporter permease [Rhodospirillales bacterium]
MTDRALQQDSGPTEGFFGRVVVRGIVHPLKAFPFGIYPSLMIGIFFMIPFVIMLVISFAVRTESFYKPGFDLEHYARFFSPLFTTHLWVSVQFAALASFFSLVVAVPFTFFISRFRRRPQIVALVFILCVLTLSEVIIAYSLSVIMSRSGGLPNVAEWLGFVERARSWYPSYLANLFGLSFFNIPFAVLVLYPACTRLDRELTEAAQTMGASPVKTFFTIVVPLLDRTIMAAFILLFVFTMGAFVTPTWLARPEDTMMAQLIAEQALGRGNIPFAAALSIFFMVVTLALSLLTVRLRRGDRTSGA